LTPPVIDDHGRPEPPLEADELDMLVGFLDYQRATLEWKTRGLTADGMRATVGVSTMTLGGLLKHMAMVENVWFSRFLHANGRAAPFDAVDWDAEPDWEFTSAVDDSPEELRALWQSFVERSRVLLADALATNGDLGRRTPGTWPEGDSPSIRWVLVHMIEEYARHNGHADLLREIVDGETGE
jgi:uncharacterized damage-inducible protein DinB